MKTVFFTVTACLSMLLAFGQEPTTPHSHWLIEPGYGVYAPIHYKTVFFVDMPHSKAAVLGPVSLRVLYQPASQQRLRVGVEFSYCDQSTDYLNGAAIGYLQVAALKGLVSLQYDFIQEEKVGIYAAGGVGLQSGEAVESLNFYEYDFNDVNEEYQLSPFAARAALGLRYQLSQHIGVWGEGGYSGRAGALASGGLSFRF